MDFVPFEIAKKLKEKGFDWETSNVYERNTIACRYEDYPKPTISQVLKWLREEKKIYLYIDVDDKGWFFEIKFLKTHKVLNPNLIGRYNSYELAAIAGIEYALDNLI